MGIISLASGPLGVSIRIVEDPSWPCKVGPVLGMKEECGFGSGLFGMDGSPGFSTVRAPGEQWAQAVLAVAYGCKLEDLGILAAGSHQSDTETAVLLRESPLGLSKRLQKSSAEGI